jgi:hypothetical protein
MGSVRLLPFGKTVEAEKSHQTITLCKSYTLKWKKSMLGRDEYTDRRLGGVDHAWENKAFYV